jgi:1-deoxy-D-xylulose-5-phosphate reductoisomerase
MKSLSIIGSTGSIGTQSIDIVTSNPERYRVVALAARKSWELLAQQAELLKPKLVAIVDEAGYAPLKQRLQPLGIEVVQGMAGVEQAAALAEADTVISTFVGMAGLLPTLAALEAGKTVALANKETLVVAGELVMATARRNGVAILPVDSEHSAIFQCLNGEPVKALSRIILTASGGPFRQTPADQLPGMTAAQALKHPTWTMGAKISIDSASLMNKGFEVLEAAHLFGCGLDRVDVWVHPQSIVHSLVEFVDGSVMAQLGPPNMRTPIAYALTFPDRLPPAWSKLTLEHMKSLTFEAPRTADFPCLELAFEAGRQGGTLPAVLNAANEIAVELFLNNQISFGELPKIIEKTMAAHTRVDSPTLATLLEVDAWARQHASQMHILH